ncbi:hypothetical protein EYF80_027283 [Liparis tanakae]|uniref:Uncharacterized protein n=1 Tax=Liparis tanakae TaxID=230148 RepID=A0A4Z2HAD7_9TELE|nr:hypothetical protein EYF80_027283 [Liparis tanakae]
MMARQFEEEGEKRKKKKSRGIALGWGRQHVRSEKERNSSHDRGKSKFKPAVTVFSDLSGVNFEPL